MKFPKVLSAMVAASILLATVAGVTAEPKANFADGVDWTRKVVTMTGVGIAPPNTVNQTQAKGLAATAAKADAYRKIGETINGVRVEGDTTVENMLTTKDTIRLRVEATIKGAKIIDETFLSDGGYRVTVQVPIFGVSNSLAGAVFERNQTIEPFPDPVFEVAPSGNYVPLSTNISNLSLSGMSVLGTADLQSLREKSLTVCEPIYQPTAIANSQIAYETPNATLNQQTVRKSVEEYASDAKGDYTGLVVDCRGLGLQPVMSPVIKNSNGTKIYGHKNLDIDRVIREGMADYVDDTSNIARAGEKPLVIKAESLDNFNSNPVVAIPDSNRILIENHATKFLKDLKVVFLFD